MAEQIEELDRIDTERIKFASALKSAEETAKDLRIDLKSLGEEVKLLKELKEKNMRVNERLKQENEKLLKKTIELEKTLHRTEDKCADSLCQQNELRKSI